MPSPLVKMLAHRAPLTALAVDPTGRFMSSAGAEGGVKVRVRVSRRGRGREEEKRGEEEEEEKKEGGGNRRERGHIIAPPLLPGTFEVGQLKWWHTCLIPSLPVHCFEKHTGELEPPSSPHPHTLLSPLAMHVSPVRACVYVGG